MTSNKIQSVEDLDVYREAYSIVIDVYRLTQSFPKEEQYGLTSQIRRAAISVIANISEGKGRSGSNEFRHFVSIARGSVEELKCYLKLAVDLGFASNEKVNIIYERCESVSRMLSGLYRSLSKNQN